jgi:hypothetical protein
MPVTAGARWASQTCGLKFQGSADLSWVPTKWNAGPGPAMMTWAVPSPVIAA